ASSAPCHKFSSLRAQGRLWAALTATASSQELSRLSNFWRLLFLSLSLSLSLLLRYPFSLLLCLSRPFSLSHSFSTLFSSLSLPLRSEEHTSALQSHLHLVF